MLDNFYGFRAAPFQLTPDPSFYFESLTHRKALSYLSYGLAQAEGFIVITGEIGAGKSTLVAHLMEKIDRQHLTAAVISTGHNDTATIRAVAFAFNLQAALGEEGEDKTVMLSAMEKFLHAEALAGRRCLLVVDEVQKLSVEALDDLRMLSNFQLGAHPLLQILLLGQPEFRETLDGSAKLEPLRQRVIARHHLDAMEVDEIEPYIIHRLTHAGWDGCPSFDSAIIPTLYRASAGVPRRINQIMSRLLLLGEVDHQPRLDLAMLNEVLDEMAQDKAPESNRASTNATSVGATDFAAAFVERDAQITELQQAVIELANQHEAFDKTGSAAMESRLARLEARLSEQERTLRHTLTMLIEWIEQDAHRNAA